MTATMDFDFHPFMTSHGADMLGDGYNAVTETNLWDWLKEFTPEDGKGFMFS